MNDLRQIVADAIAAGWAVVPIAPGEKKGPTAWNKTTYGPSDFGPNHNLAYKCGAPSDHRVDVDCDAPEAVEAARHLLPTTGRVHGRPGKPESHYWFRSEGATTCQFTDVGSTMLIELRSTGGYTVVPPSIWTDKDDPAHTEELSWASERDLMALAPDALKTAVRHVAIAALLARHWPGSGQRHVVAGPLAGFLGRAGIPSVMVLKIIEVAATIAGDPDVNDRLAFARSTLDKLDADAPVTGGPTLTDHLGEAVVARLRLWLNVREGLLDPQDPMPSARAFVQLLHHRDDTLTLRHYAGSFYRHERAYREVDEATVRADLWSFLEGAKTQTDKGVQPFKPTKAKLENVLDALRAVTNLPSTTDWPCWLTPHELVPTDLLVCQNGILHLPTRTLHPLTPQLFTMNALDFDYVPASPEPTAWLAFLASLWPQDQASIDTLQEIFGYLLTTDTSFQKIFMLVGPKRCGKGTIGRMLRRLIGPDNMCTPTLASFGSEFGKQPLIGKTFALISDARLSGRTDAAAVVETLLSISGEDAQSVNRKFLPAWNGPMPVRFLILTNLLPSLTDASGALASRFVILQLTESFYGREDLTLDRRLAPEASAILTWALDGRDRLFRRGHFEQPKSAASTVQQLDDLGSPIRTFLRERCDIDARAEVKKADLFHAWKTWCQGNNVLNVGTEVMFGRDLHAALPHLQVTQHRDRNTSSVLRYYKGLRLTRPLLTEPF
jgi:putative DNA primase/helicase